MAKKTPTMRMIEVLYGKPIEKLLYEMYIEQGMTQAEIAAELSIGSSTVCKWLRRVGIGFGIPGG